ncbi:MAG: putative porin [Acidobacteria bacterium]|nr:putative porin [Acidobacteriota bacterium]
MDIQSRTRPRARAATFRLAVAFLVICPVAAAGQQAGAAARPWWERITFGGDFRARYEGFFQDDRPARNRERFRLRVTMRAPITDEVAFGLRLASGSADDITSSNQSFGEFLARKPISLDQAFLTYTPSGFRALTLGAGKYAYPVRRTQMVWDDDVNWEGTYEQVAGTVGITTLRFVAVQSPINEVGGGGDAFLLGWYGEAGWSVTPHTFGVWAANYRFLREDQIAVGVDRSGLANANTNLLTRNTAGQVTGFASEFNLIDVTASATLATGHVEYPVNLLANGVWNTQAATGEDAGAWVSAGIGRAATPGTVSFAYTFGRIEQDAVVRTFNFSDIPGTNIRMHLLAFSYMPAPRLNLEATAILTKPLVDATGPAADLLKRIQVDGRVSF